MQRLFFEHQQSRPDCSLYEDLSVKMSLKINKMIGCSFIHTMSLNEGNQHFTPVYQEMHIMIFRNLQITFLCTYSVTTESAYVTCKQMHTFQIHEVSNKRQFYLFFLFLDCILSVKHLENMYWYR